VVSDPLIVSYLLVDCQLTSSLIAVLRSGRTFTLFAFKRALFLAVEIR